MPHQTSTISGPLDPITLAPVAPSLGDQVTFAVETAETEEPWVQVVCKQSGTVVYEQYNGFFDRYLGGEVFTLGPTRMWTSGPADATAFLLDRDKYPTTGKNRVLASVDFTVSG